MPIDKSEQRRIDNYYKYSEKAMFFDARKFNLVKERWLTEEWLLKQLFKAERKARKGKTHTRDVYLFEMNLMENLEQLAHDIWTGVYYPRRGVAFVIDKPVVREIFAAQFRDRVVHHFLFDQVYEWWDKHFINNSYSCRVGKGALYGVKMMVRQMRRVSENYTVRSFVLKLDVQGFFMSIDRIIVYKRVKWGLGRQFTKKYGIRMLLEYIWARVIFDDPCNGVTIRGKKSDWRRLPKTKTLFGQPVGKGIVIGNLSSQLLSNILMDLLDRYIMYELGYKEYGRYVDDFYIFVQENDYARLKKDEKLIRDFLKNKLGLTIHPHKRYCQTIDKGVEFLGVVVKPKYQVVSRRFKRNFYQAAAEVGMGYRDAASIVSYLGRLKHIDGKKLAMRVFDKMGWEYHY